MHDQYYASKRHQLLKDIKALTGRDVSGRFPLLETKVIDEEYVERYEAQLERLERAAAEAAASIGRT